MNQLDEDMQKDGIKAIENVIAFEVQSSIVDIPTIPDCDGSWTQQVNVKP